MRIETSVSALMLSPRETEKLVIYQVAELARRRRDRGLRLNFPEAVALVAEALLEAARDGRSVAETIELGKQVLSRDDVMEGVPEMVNLVQVEATFRTGTQLVSVSNPIPSSRASGFSRTSRWRSTPAGGRCGCPCETLGTGRFRSARTSISPKSTGRSSSSATRPSACVSTSRPDSRLG